MKNIVNYLVLVNKENKLPSDWDKTINLKSVKNFEGDIVYVEEETLKNFLKLKDALKNEGIEIDIISAYRKVEDQEEIFNDYKEKYGIDYVNRYVAIPGYSEHHTGLVIDICLKINDKYIYENYEMMEQEEIFNKIHKKLMYYGFILRYPKGKENITGYNYEPWHFRYVGDVAKEITLENLTLEEYLLKNKEKELVGI